MLDDLLNVDSTSYVWSTNDYRPIESLKKYIVIHFTAGNSLEGAVSALSTPDYVAVPFILDKDGSIYQTFSTKYWAFHLGIKGTEGKYDRCSIAIEIVNVGPLVQKADGLYWWPRNFGAKYCDLTNTDLYYDLGPNNMWRNYRYFATYNADQYDALGKLLGYLCIMHSIPPQFIQGIESQLIPLPTLDNFSGIFTHHNVRMDKTDCGLAMNYQYLNNLTQTAYQYYKENWNDVPKVIT